MHTKRKNLKQRDNDLANYTNEFQKLCLRSKVQEAESIEIERYVIELRWNIQEEIKLWTPNTIQKCYQLALQVEEKLKKKQDFNNRSRGKGRDSVTKEETFVEEEAKKLDPKGILKKMSQVD